MNLSTSCGPSSLFFRASWGKGEVLMRWSSGWCFLFPFIRNCSGWFIAVLFSVNHSKRHVPLFPHQIFHLRGERAEFIWAFIRCWDKSYFHSACFAILIRFSSHVNQEVIVLGKLLTRFVPMFVWCQRTMVHMRLLRRMLQSLALSMITKNFSTHSLNCAAFRRCLQRTGSIVFGTQDPTPRRSSLHPIWKERRVVIDSFPSRIEQNHPWRKQQPRHAEAYGSRGQFCRSVALACFVPQGDRTKR